MTGRRIFTFTLLAISLLSGVLVLSRSVPPATMLPRADGVGYRTVVSTYFDGEGLVCQPFKIAIVFDDRPDRERPVLFAEQADDVVIAQTSSVLYVFYNDLALTHFGTSTIHDDDAKPLLCDTGIPFCAEEMKRIADAGTRMARVCGRIRR